LLASRCLVSLLSILAVAATAASSSALAGEAADIIISNARIYTMDASRPRASAIAVRGERILAVGSDAEIAAFAGPETRQLNAAGKTMLPGFHDAHVHTQMAGVQALFACDFSPDLSAGAFAEALRACAERTPPGAWVNGGRWRENNFPESRPDRAFLDRIVPDKPVHLVHESYHYAIVNSRALELAGVTRDTPDPDNGTIETDPDTGAPTGVLRESAQQLVTRVIPQPSVEQSLEAVRWAQHQLNRFGITSISAALASEPELRAYHRLADEGELTLDVHAHLPWRVDFPGIPPLADQRALLQSRSRFESSRVSVNGIKMFIDGVPMLHTAAMLEPYADDPAKRGALLHAQDRLNADVVELDRRGLSVKMHAVGDAAARAVFEAVAAARRANGPGGPVHQMAHCNLVDPADLTRFAELRVACELSPYFWAPGLGGPPLERWTELLGAGRRDRLWGAAEIAAAGALLIAGSDWPVVDAPNPWPAIEGLVLRSDPYGEVPGTLGPDQGLGRWQAISMFTTNPAEALGRMNERGTLAPGKLASLIMLDRDVAAIPDAELSQVTVLATMLRGRFEFIRQ